MVLSLVLKAFALLLLLGLPLMAVDEESLGPEFWERARRPAVYLSGSISLALLAGLTLAVVAWQGVEARDLGWRGGDREVLLAWAAGATGVGLALVGLVSRILERLGLEESRLALFLLPRTWREKRDFVLLALVAAVCEEYVYRGFLLHAFEAWGGGMWMAGVVTSLSFGLAHGYQRLAGIVRATLLGGILAAAVAGTGSLIPAVAAHLGINVTIGLGGWRWLVAGGELPE